jgi:nucleoid DNA-binding protein
VRRRRSPANADLTGEQTRSVVDAAFDAIAGELVAGRDVAIAGFGKFTWASARRARGATRDR